MHTFLTCFIFVKVTANYRHVICKRNRWKIPEHIVTGVYIFMNACRDGAAEKQFDNVIQMTLEHVLIQIFKKKEMNEKSNFWERHINDSKLANCYGRII